ncbi:SAM-dependent methyltransferase [Saccharopolyspora hordei]|uniref:O-methyltransferase involved in polyketide biosynthesis n=1 Tax=Saccharopolyspora hordei TaxID=1838 RepID=A0A853AHB8_9PSEU|nr:SAM-dependent methyltransferase [Saccharopolyspora hordei]NYI83388.1 O-methyltransferase involved in polyketide biosynthesis [Saccharopolyspora hordei]
MPESEDIQVRGSTVSDEMDTTVPHAARVWNFWLDGKDHYAVDRAAGEEFLEVFPGMKAAAQASRGCLGRMVRHLVTECGVRQFLDVGTGLPTAENTHEIAQRAAPESRIVYVDNDPLVLAHARALLTSTPEGSTRYVHADVREPETIVEAAREALDLDQPVGLILFGILGLIPEHAQARSIVDTLLAALPSGSYLALFDVDDTDPVAVEAARQYAESGAVPYNHRSPEEIAGYFTGLELVEPGVVRSGLWRAEPSEVSRQDTTTLAGLGRKP